MYLPSVKFAWLPISYSSQFVGNQFADVALTFNLQTVVPVLGMWHSWGTTSSRANAFLILSLTSRLENDSAH